MIQTALSPKVLYFENCQDMTSGFLLIDSDIFSYANLIQDVLQEAESRNPNGKSAS